MAGWINSTGTGPGTGSGGGRGAGGRGFPNHRNTTDVIHGGGGGGGAGSGRWRERSRGRPPPQPHYRYRPVEAAHRHSPPAPAPPQHHYASAGPAPSGQAASSTSTRHAQIASSADKSSTSVTGTPASASSTREPEDKASRNAANFECNVCFDMAAEPVVTKCGHLFCWECLYQWLHVHSHHLECPVCKGQVADDAIIPIYGRGGSAASVDNAPPRPTGVRVESARQQHQHQLHTFPHPMVSVDEEEEDPFDIDFGGVNFGFGSSSIRDAVMSFMPSNFVDVDMADQYDDYTNDHEADEFEEIYDYHLLGFPLFPSVGPGAEAGNPSSSQAHPDLINLTDSINGLYHHRDFSHSGANSNNRGWHGYGRRNRVRARSSASADHSTDAVVMGSSLSFYNDASASHNVNASRSTRPNGGWAERRGRSNRNSNSAGGRGMQDSRRMRTTHYN